MSKNLSEVLEGVDIDKNIKTLIPHIEIVKVSVNRRSKKWNVYIKSVCPISSNVMDAIKSMIKYKYSIDNDINIICENSAESQNEVSKIDTDDVIKHISTMFPSAGGWIKNSETMVEGNDYDFILWTEFGVKFLLSKGCDKLMEGYISEKYNRKVHVNIMYKEKKGFQKEYCSEKKKEDESLISKLIKSRPSAKNESAKERTNSYILGRRIDEEIAPIKSLNEASGRVTIEGDVFDVKIIVTRNNKTIISFNITDYEGSITVKVFTSDKNCEFLKDSIKPGARFKVRGDASYDRYAREVVMLASDIQQVPAILREDDAPQKRVELHLHTQMSSMDGISSASDLVETAARWGHRAVAITDHGVVQAFPEAAEAAKKNNIKVIYGVESYLADDGAPIVLNANDMDISGEYIALDIETTGLSSSNDRIIEIGAARIRNGNVVEEFNELIDPEIPIPENIVQLTGIDDTMVSGKRKINEVLPDFINFAKDGVLVAHNAKFDIGFIKKNCRELNIEINNPVIDTLTLSKLLFPNLKRYKLDVVAKHLGISLKNHHRAVDDAVCAGNILIKCIDIMKDKNVKTISDINKLFKGKQDFKKMNTYHTVLLVKNHEGLLNLYKLISISHLNYFYRKPRILRSVLEKYREGIIVGSGCQAGLLYREILNGASDSELADIVRFYDYLEIQPLGNNEFMVRENIVDSEDTLKKINMRILKLGKKYNRPVVATGDVHFLNPHDEIFRRILMHGQGYEDADNQAPLYFKTTDEMLEEFSYLGKDNAYDVVVKNPNMIADMIENIKPIPDETFPPKIDGADEDIKNMSIKRAHDIYGEKLPEIVEKRLDRELSSIINHGYAVLYLIAQKLVSKSVHDGYLVGSRGSVGSSFVATMCGITEVNPLPPHYVCPDCKYSEFITDGSYGSGADMPDKTCPKCGCKLKKDGHDIPFEVFLGFEGDKEPDIDLNFSGEYQPIAHKYTEELFGKGHVFRAGTIGTIAEKTAYGFVKNYLQEKNIYATQAEIDRLTKGCTGVKRTTGQHPGGVMVVPRDNEIYQFTPVQHPADDVNSNIITTHFDYHSISGRLLKLDILGHDDPTVIRMLQDLSGIDPKTIPIGDKKVLSLFTSPEALGVTKEDIDCEVGTLGLPEFGTKFVRQMLVDTKPKTFAELVRISGLSHGTDVWLNNAQELIKNGTATLKEVISTRDDIMLYLIKKGMKPKSAFTIMERVRKGRGLRDEDIDEMKQSGVPQWYIDSCQKIKYMFPKGHAVAYVMMAMRIAYFKVYMPLYYYAAYFSIRADQFDADIISKGENAVKDKISEIEKQGNDASQKDKELLTILEIAYEMYKRGFKFYNVDIYKSDAVKFLIRDDGLLPPLNSLQGLGVNAAKNIARAREDGEYISIEDLRTRAKVSKTVVEILKNHGCLKGMPETNQLTLF